MDQVTCPNCKTVLKAPGSGTYKALRCPACRRVFEFSQVAQGAEGQTFDGRSSAFAEKLVNGSNGGVNPLTPTAIGASTILSDADEAMLREFGSGSGLLALTRDAYTPPAGDVRDKTVLKTSTAPVETDEQPPADLERQFQIVGTALTFANKLVQAHKGEMGRMRASHRQALIVLGCLAILCALMFGWAMMLKSDVEVANTQAASLQLRLNEEKDSSARKDETIKARDEYLKTKDADLKAAAKVHDNLQEQYSTAKSEAARADGVSKTFQGQLEASQKEVSRLTAQVRELNDQIAGLHTTTRPTK